jgi:hypothetical protein
MPFHNLQSALKRKCSGYFPSTGEEGKRRAAAQNDAEWPTLVELRKLMEARGAEAVVKVSQQACFVTFFCKRCFI